MIKIKINNARQKKNLSTRDLAELIGIGKSTMNNIENNKTSPRLCHLEQMAKVLEVKITDLFDSEYK